MEAGPLASAAQTRRAARSRWMANNPSPSPRAALTPASSPKPPVCIKGMLILRSAPLGRKPKDRSLRPLVPAPGPLRPKPRLRLSAGPWLPRQTAPCSPLRAWICFNSLEKACCVSPQACKPNTGIIGFRVRGRTKCQPQTLIRAAWNSVSSEGERNTHSPSPIRPCSAMRPP